MTLLRRLAANVLHPFFAPSATRTLFHPLMLLGGHRLANEGSIRALCNVAYVGDDTVMCRALGRYKIFADTNDHGLAPHIMLDGYWEMWVTEAIAAELRPGMVVADIGANIGYFTLLMADMVGPTGRVHAFEPNPRMASLLQRSLAINGFANRSHVHETALADTDGIELALVIPENEPKNGHIQPLVDPSAPGVSRVLTQRLDSRADWLEIEFAKIDVEGAEEMIWAGATGLLEASRLRTIVLEFTPARYGDAGAFLERIISAGFSLSQIDVQHGPQIATIASILEGSPLEDRMLLLKR